MAKKRLKLTEGPVLYLITTSSGDVTLLIHNRQKDLIEVCNIDGEWAALLYLKSVPDYIPNTEYICHL